MAFTIRQLGPGDVPIMRQLNALFGSVFEDPASYAAKPPADSYLETLLAKEHFLALVAMDGAAVVAGLAAYQLDKFEQARSEIYIYDLAVAVSHRRRGIARALITELTELAAERGCWVVYVQADYGDDPAIALYTALGTREDVLHFDIAVPHRT